MEDEDVVLPNSPLHKYLNEIGFNDFEDANGQKKQEELGKSNHGSAWSYKDGLPPFSQTVFELVRYIYSSSLSWFVLVPSVDDIETFRNDYIAAVYESQTLKKDDIRFLSQFDPKLFVCGKSSMHSGFGEWRSFAYGNYILSFLLLAISALLAKIDGVVIPSVFIFLVILFVSVAKVLQRYFFVLQHRRNLAALRRFIRQTKQLSLLVKRSLNLIQEIELTLKGSIGNLHVGIKKIVWDDLTEKMSLQGLINVASLLSSLQSEFLSRFLLCLSPEASDGNLNELYIKLFKNVDKIFGISSKMIECSVTSIKRSYHVHESYCFINKESEKPPVKPRVNQTASALHVALHSIQRHLQVGILRVQSLQKEKYKWSESKGDHEPKAKHSFPANLEVAFQWLKSDLDSALTCWQEGEAFFSKLLGKEPTVNQNRDSFDTMSDESLEESHDLCALELKEDVEEVDKVYEAFSDPYEEVAIGHQTPNVEDVKKELREARENKRLLQELKTVLLSKAKDPLIGTSGFVQPAVKQPINTVSKTWPCDGPGGISMQKEETKNCFNFNDSSPQKWLSSNEVHNQLSALHANEHPNGHPMLLGTFPSVAVSVAAAAAAHGKAMGLNEDTFCSEDTE
ncbi:Vezatin [Stylophora pistillata]|uniref:Vezatin n=1 Tax=Stylophora pistillata TaxID=50429 RepID=A0A2B4SQF9_STYPI|nr:Vezatin [Stylophora pistillata]